MSLIEFAELRPMLSPDAIPFLKEDRLTPPEVFEAFLVRRFPGVVPGLEGPLLKERMDKMFESIPPDKKFYFEWVGRNTGKTYGILITREGPRMFDIMMMFAEAFETNVFPQVPDVERVDLTPLN